MLNTLSPEMPLFEVTHVTTAYYAPHPSEQSEAGLVAFLFFWLIKIDMLILGPENTTFWGNSCYYSLAQYLYLY